MKVDEVKEIFLGFQQVEVFDRCLPFLGLNKLQNFTKFDLIHCECSKETHVSIILYLFKQPGSQYLNFTRYWDAFVFLAMYMGITFYILNSIFTSTSLTYFRTCQISDRIFVFVEIQAAEAVINTTGTSQVDEVEIKIIHLVI